MDTQEEKIAALEEAVRVIGALDDKGHLYQNQLNLLTFAFFDARGFGICDIEDLVEHICDCLSEAEAARQMLLELLQAYLQIMKDIPDPEPDQPRHPLLRRSGKR